VQGRRWLRSMLLLWLTSLFPHFVWEIWHFRFYECMAKTSYVEAVWMGTKATVGDATIALAAYVLAVPAARSIDWLKSPSIKPVAIYFFAGVSITVLLEYFATEVWNRWSYSEAMPTIPPLGTGLLPVAQWIVVPAITLYTARLMYLGLCSSDAPLADSTCSPMN
jgi:hypothetical protein